MGNKARLVGILLILIGGYLIFNAFDDQIISELIKQGTDVPDFFIDVFTPEVSDNELMQAGIGFVILFVGIILLFK